jgi:N-carbamoyl-L-amino-acid hydrolase
MKSQTTAMTKELKIDIDRLMTRIEALGEKGALPGGGVCRLALTDEDKEGRDLVVSWMKELGLKVTIDEVGNVIGLRAGKTDGAPVLIGSHIDTVRTGGYYDGNLGVLAGLEVVECLNDSDITTECPIGVGIFTNEEGARFAPDMLGSMVHQGQLEKDTALDAVSIDGKLFKDELARIGYDGSEPVGDMRTAGFLELHVEQGPILEQEGITIGAVEGVQGISWTEVKIEGVSNHAGTTPMSMRRDAGFCAAKIAVFVRELALRMGGRQVATVGAITLTPNLVNVVANNAKMTVDLRNTDNALLKQADMELAEFLTQLADDEQVKIETKTLARFDPVDFAPEVIGMVEEEALAMGLSVKRMPSGAGHDAQSFAPNCPSGMIFVPSVKGISHNIEEYTAPSDLEAGANVLFRVLLRFAGCQPS